MRGSFGFEWGGVVIYSPSLGFISKLFNLSATLGNINAIRQYMTKVSIRLD